MALHSPSHPLRKIYAREVTVIALGWSKKLTLNREPPMPAVGQKRTSEHVRGISALPAKADIRQGNRDVRFVPKADIPRCSKHRRSRTDAMASLSGSRPDFFSLFVDLTDSSLNFVLRD